MQHQQQHNQATRQAMPSQAPLFPLGTEDLAAFLRAEYARLEPYRPVLERVSRRCCEELRRSHHLPVNPSDVLASAEDFLLALLNRPVLELQEAGLAATMHAHLMAHYLEADARRSLQAAQERRREQAVIQVLKAVDSVLVRATAVAAEELRRLHGIELRPADVLVAVNDALHECAEQDEGRTFNEYELERLVVDQTVSAFLAARLTLQARQRPSAG